jgi:RNA polymerase sigma-70 factor (ECF subfamily)
MMDDVVTPTVVDDRVLLDRIALGDASALRALHDRHLPWLRGRLRHRCGDDDVVFEALQDTFVAVWRNPLSWNGTGEVPAWLWGIAVRRLIGAHRTRNHWSSVADAGAGPDAGADEAVYGIEDVDALVTAMGALDRDLQAAVRATYLDGLSVAEASVLLSVPPGTVKTRVMRAKAQLRGALT